MTGRDDELLPEGVPAFDDPAYNDLRAELADLGDVGPLPVEVAARLDDVLAGLRESSVDSVHDDEPLTDAPVVPLRRRSSAGKRLLVAAAAVVAVGGGGIGLASVVDGGVSGSGDDTAMADRSVAESAPNAAVDEGSSPELSAGGGVTSYRKAAVPELDSRNFSAEAAELITTDGDFVRLLSRASRAPAAAPDLQESSGQDTSEKDEEIPPSQDGLVPEPSAPDRDGAAADNLYGSPNTLSSTLKTLQTCAVRSVTGGVARPVLLDGSPAILVVYPVIAGERLVQARTCDADTVLVSAFVPVS